MNNDFREQMRELIQRKGAGIPTTAKRAGITPATIYNFLNGDSEMTTANYGKVLDVLNAMPDKSLSTSTKELEKS